MVWNYLHLGAIRHGKCVKTRWSYLTQTLVPTLLLPRLHVNHVHLRLRDGDWIKRHHVELTFWKMIEILWKENLWSMPFFASPCIFLVCSFLYKHIWYFHLWNVKSWNKPVLPKYIENFEYEPRWYPDMLVVIFRICFFQIFVFIHI
jgi:hypothetical protein